jgi:hypothetical protein
MSSTPHASRDSQTPKVHAWVSETLAARQAPPEIKLPVSFTVFPGEVFRAPGSRAEKSYPSPTYFNEVDRGGHFAAWTIRTYLRIRCARQAALGRGRCGRATHGPRALMATSGHSRTLSTGGPAGTSFLVGPVSVPPTFQAGHARLDRIRRATQRISVGKTGSCRRLPAHVGRAGVVPAQH